MTATAVYALAATPLAYLIGGIVVFAWINTPYQFSKRLASASGVQYYVHKGMGADYGYMAGLSYYVYYVSILGANILVYALVIPLIMSNFGITLPSLSWIPITILLFLPVLLITYFGIRFSLTYGVITVILEVIILFVTSLIIILNPSVHNTLSVYNPFLASNGISGFGIALLIASFGISGTTATVYMGSEAKVPFKTIKRALLLSTLIIFGIYIITSYAYTVGWGINNMGNFATSIGPGLIEIGKYMGPIPELAVLLFAINSLIGLTVASLIIDARLAMSFSKQGLFPKSLQKIHRKYKTPYQATLFSLLLGVVMTFVVAYFLGPFNAFVWLIEVATMGEFLGHIIGDIALPLYYKGKKDFSLTKHLLLPIISLGVIAFGIFFSFYPVIFPLIYAPIFVVLILLIGFIQARFIYMKNAKKRDGLYAISEIGEETGE